MPHIFGQKKGTDWATKTEMFLLSIMISGLVTRLLEKETSFEEVT